MLLVPFWESLLECLLSICHGDCLCFQMQGTKECYQHQVTNPCWLFPILMRRKLNNTNAGCNQPLANEIAICSKELRLEATWLQPLRVSFCEVKVETGNGEGDWRRDSAKFLQKRLSSNEVKSCSKAIKLRINFEILSGLKSTLTP